MRVLLVDDHPMFRAGFAVLLSALDASIEVVHANNCAEAVAQADSAFDLVLLDMQLPDMSGLESITVRRATSRSRRTRTSWCRRCGWCSRAASTCPRSR